MTPAGAARLRHEIESATGERISLNTLKRLVGVIGYEGMFRPVILDIIARYLGYSGYQVLADSILDRVSGFNVEGNFIEAASVPEDRELELIWQPGRRVSMINLGAGRFRVRESENSKLMPGDILEIDFLAAGFPLYVKRVIREGEDIGTYQAAATEGLTKLRII